MKIDYNKQAEDFLTKTNTKFTVKFKYHGPYFDDNATRDVYTVTLTRNSKIYNFEFGQSITDSFPNKPKPPTAYDVFSTIVKNDPGTFEEFCSEYDYDTDSITAHKVYIAVMSQWKNLTRMFNETEMLDLQEIC